jgi:AraC family transcriptional regulator
LPPAAYRTAGSHARFVAKAKQGEVIMFEVSIREIPARQAVTLAHKGSYQQIGRAFEQVGTWFALRGLLTPSTRMVGLYFDDPAAVAEEELRSLAGIVVETAPAMEPPFALTVIQGGEYAVLRHKGPYVDLPAAYRWLYGTWLPLSGREVADAPPFEEYLNTPRETAPPDLLTDICVPLK